MRVLFLSRWFPYPPDNGSKIRVFNILRQLSGQHEVALLSFKEGDDYVTSDCLPPDAQTLATLRTVPYRGFSPGSRKALLGLLSTQPRFLVDTFSKQMCSAARTLWGSGDYDLVIASQLSMVPYALSLPRPRAVLEELELSLFLDRLGHSNATLPRMRPALTWLKLAGYLRRALPQFAACTVVSQSEERNVGKAAPGYHSVRVIPNAVDLEDYRREYPPPQPNTLLFCGALTYSANYDGIKHFLNDIHPLIARDVPELVVSITGKTEGVDLSRLSQRPAVRYTGYVSDIRPLVAQSWASIVPLRNGGGTRLKILESMALGTPVISTSKGAEGLDVTDGENILIADDPKQFAAQTMALLGSSDMRKRLSQAGRRLIEEKYSWQVVGKALLGLLDEVGAR